jgi:hypothetical protein
MLRMTIVRLDGALFYSRIYVLIPGYTSVLNGSGNYINQISQSPLKTVWPRFIKRVSTGTPHVTSPRGHSRLGTPDSHPIPNGRMVSDGTIR